MVNTILVEKQIDDGISLIKKIDEARLNLKAAFWLYDSDSEKWRLCLALPMVDSQGPKKTYDKMQKIIEPISKDLTISILDIFVISPKQKIVELLKTVINTGDTISGIRFTGNSVNGQFIDDVYIYRLS